MRVRQRTSFSVDLGPVKAQIFCRMSASVIISKEVKPLTDCSQSPIFLRDRR